MSFQEIRKLIDEYESKEGKELTLEQRNIQKVKHIINEFETQQLLANLLDEEYSRDLDYSDIVELQDKLELLKKTIDKAKEEIDLDEFYKRGEIVDFKKLRQIYKDKELKKRYPSFDIKAYEELLRNPPLEIQNFKGEVIKYDSYVVKKILLGINQMIFDEMDLYIANCGGEGCLAGDTIVQVNKAKSSYKYTIKELYLKWTGQKRSKRWNEDIPLYTRSYDGDKVKLHKIKNVTYSGKKKTYTLTLKDGKSIRATETHKFISKDGWKRLDELKVGDSLLVDTNKPRRNGRKKVKLYDIQLKAKYHPYKSKTGRVEVHRLCYEAYQNGLTIHDLMDILTNDEDKSRELSFVNPALYDIHHKDKNHYNNSEDNLQLLTKQEHKAIHGQENYRNFSQGIVNFSEIVSITEHGIEETFDIECEEPYHNFVANDIIVHNSGKSCWASQLILYLYTVLKQVGLIEYEYDVKKLFYSSLKTMMGEMDEQAEKNDQDYFRIFALDEAYELNRSNYREEGSKLFKDSMRSDRKLQRILILNLPQLGELELPVIQTRLNFIFDVKMDSQADTGTLKKGLIDLFIMPRGSKIYSTKHRQEITKSEIVNSISQIMRDKNDSYKGLPINCIVHQFKFSGVWGFDKEIYDAHIKKENRKRRTEGDIKLTNYQAYLLFRFMPPLKEWDKIDKSDSLDKKAYYSLSKFAKKIKTMFYQSRELEENMQRRFENE